MKNNNHLDQVEQALESFRDVAVPDGPSAELANTTAERLRSMAIPVATRQSSNRNLRLKATRFGGAIAACALLVVAAAWTGMLSLAGGIAFADVKQQLEKMRTVRYVDTRLVDEAGDDVEEMREMERNGIKPEPGRIFKPAGNMYQPRIIRVAGRHLQRVEILNDRGAIEMIQITDHNHGKHVTLTPKQKLFVELDGQVTLEFGSDKTTEEKIKPTPDVDLFAGVSQLPAEAVTQLPARVIGGQKVIGFFSQQTTPTKEGTVTWERTYWVDPATKLPVQIEISHYGTDKRFGRSDWVQSHFVFDEEIPADQFSTDPPKGYTRETQKIFGIKMD